MRVAAGLDVITSSRPRAGRAGRRASGATQVRQVYLSYLVARPGLPRLCIQVGLPLPPRPCLMDPKQRVLGYCADNRFMMESEWNAARRTAGDSLLAV